MNNLLTVYLLVKTVWRICHRVAIWIQAVRMFCLDGHTQDGIWYEFVIQDHMRHFFPIREPVCEHFLVGVKLHRVLGSRGEKGMMVRQLSKMNNSYISPKRDRVLVFLVTDHQLKIATKNNCHGKIIISWVSQLGEPFSLHGKTCTERRRPIF